MNFEFIRERRLESDELQAMYDNVLQELERAEHYYWRKPQECGIILRQTTERICRIYNTYYQISRERFAGRVFVLYGRKRAQRDGEPFFERRPQGAARPAE